MDLNNVYFSNLKKFDGKKLRRLKLSEISQIAGRAGRYLNDGSFGITGDCGEISAEEIELLETHKIDDIHTIYWRNPKLNFKTGDTLIKSLEEKPNKNWLRKVSECEDEKVLKYILKDTEKLQIFNNENELRLLWECCQIPDFVKKTYGNHLDVVGKVFNFLREPPGKITNKYMKQQLSILDKLDGNVDSVSNRIANVRTWSYVANKNGWVENQDYWIERTKYLEDKLSDRLHEELTKSFIDKRASVLAKGLKQDIIFETKILDNEKVLINNQFIGNLKGLKLELDFKIGDLYSDVKSLKKASRQNVGPEISERINQIIKTKNIELKKDLKVYWKNFPIAYLSKGIDYLKPEIIPIVDDVVEAENKNNLQNFLKKWINDKINTELGSLIKLKNIKSSNSSARALSYMLYENNGVLKRGSIDKLLKELDQKQRKILRDQGVKFGRYHIFLHRLFKPNVVSLRLALWKNHNQKNYELDPPIFGLNFLNNKKFDDRDFMLMCGFEKFDDCFVRIDILERLFLEIIGSDQEKNSKIEIVPKMLNLLGCSKENFVKLIQKMNYNVSLENDKYFLKYKPKKKFNKKINDKLQKDNPFAALRELNLK